jgi:hypothetical protein
MQDLLRERFDIDHVTLQPEVLDVTLTHGRPVIPIHPRSS